MVDFEALSAGLELEEVEEKIDTTLDPILTYMQEKSGVTYSDEQIAILKNEGNMSILACAGSGKTTTLNHLICRRILTGEIKDLNKVMCTTFSKGGAGEIKERLDELFVKLGIRGNVEIRTLHAMFLKIMRNLGQTEEVIDGGVRASMLRDCIKDLGIKLVDDNFKLLDTLLSYQLNNMLSDKSLADSYNYTFGEELPIEKFIEIRKLYNQKKQERGVIDYDDMQLRIWIWLTQSNREDIVQYCKSLWDIYFIDEAQDVSKLQFEILKTIVSHKEGDKIVLDKTLVFIGDDDQCIYRWRGADPTIILNIGTIFDMPRKVLSTNYRCKSSIVDPASMSIKENASRFNKTMKALEQGGITKLIEVNSNNLCEISVKAANTIEEMIRGGAECSDIAVLCRNNRHLAILSNMLLSRGIYVKANKDIRFAYDSLYHDMKTLMKIVEDTWDSKLTSEILWKLCTFLGVNGAKSIAAFQNNSGISMYDTFGYLLKYIAGYDINFDKKINVPAKEEERLRVKWFALSADTKASIKVLYEVLTSSLRDYDKLESLMGIYKAGTTFMYKSDDKKRYINGMCDYILSLVNERGIEDTTKFLRTSEQLESGKMAIPGKLVTLSTIHGAKGKEWKHVILFADDNISMPSFNEISILSDDSNVDVKTIVNYIDEERRLHYVGMTRAKDELIILHGKEPGIFTLEAMGCFNTGHNNYDIIGMASKGEVSPKVISNFNKINKIVDTSKTSEKNYEA